MTRKSTAVTDSAGVVPAGSVVVVGIGSSAGGLDALHALLPGLPVTGRLSYVVAQHLSPQHRTVLVELLAPHTALTVVLAVDGMVLEPDVVAIAPPHHDVTVAGGALHVVDPLGGPGPNPNIDRLFMSIADSCGAGGAGVVLSGTGSDGASGLRALKAAGGLTVVQSPESAKFDAMPRAAIELSAPDAVLDAGAIGAHLVALAGFGWSLEDGEVPQTDAGALSSVVSVLRRASGIDFSEYKTSTLRRQLERRMAVRQVSDVAEYLTLLSAEVAEQESLVGNLLVTVTRFFRDPEAFDALRSWLQEYLDARVSDEQVRVWVPGCATGEEVYSIAMMIDGLLDHPDQLNERLKIFGTDLDEAALLRARRGQYPASIVDHVPEDLKARYFVENSAGFEVRPELRDCTVFARHNVAVDPPFPRLDLVSFRNTSIYFTAPLQVRAFESIRFALLPGGLLILGQSEVVASQVSGLRSVDSAHKISVRVAVATGGPSSSVALPRWSHSAARAMPSHPARVEDVVPDQHLDLLQAIARVVAGPALVVDQNHDLVEVIGDVGIYCRLPEGRASSAIEGLLRPELLDEARALLLLTRAERGPVMGKPIELPDALEPVTLHARSLAVGSDPLLLLTFSATPADAEVGSNGARVVSRDDGFDVELRHLESELLRTRETLAVSLAELETTNEELQASNEELQGATEELQATNEELETSNEELQATNEELGAVNLQLRERGEDRELLLNDLENIQGALTQGMVIVDDDLRVARFSPTAVRVFALVDTDIGQPLLRVPTTVEALGLEEALRSAVRGIASGDLEFSGAGGTYLVRVLPYQGNRGQRRGALLTMTDVTELVVLRRAAQETLLDLAETTLALDQIVWRRDSATLELIHISGPIQALTGHSPSDLTERPNLLDASIHPEDRTRVDAVRQASPDAWSIRFRIVTQDGRVRDVNETASRVHRLDSDHLIGTLTDVTDLVAVQKIAADTSAIFEQVFHAPGFGIAVLDAKSRIIQANETLCEILGRAETSIQRMPLASFSTPLPGSRGTDDTGSDLLSAPIRLILRPDGETRTVTINVRALEEPIGEAVSIAFVQDTTELRAASDLLNVQARVDSLTGLPNRVSIRGACEQAIVRTTRTGTQLALAWIDLDKFKDVNDQNGHSAGDEVLRTVADRLRAATRNGDAVGRLGGDEFAVVLTDLTSLSSAELVLERILASLRLPIRVGDVTANLSGSLGVAVHPSDGATLDELMRAADAAMYAAKKHGGDKFVYFQASMNAEAETRRTTRAEIADAIREGRFELHYQPIVSARDGSVWGAESLLRLHRDGSLVGAAEFIPFCEESGQIRSLGPLTLDLLRHDLAKARAAGHHDLPLCLNLSVTQLEDRDLANSITLTGLTGLKNLVVEVTESVFLPDHERALGLMNILRGLGARVSVDDFGTGFSNLRLLKGLAPEFIKLDKSFLPGEPADSHDNALIKAAIDMAHAVGATVVAEGIETPEHHDYATGFGTDLLQGYGIARPMPLSDLLTWLEHHN